MVHAYDYLWNFGRRGRIYDFIREWIFGIPRDKKPINSNWLFFLFQQPETKGQGLTDHVEEEQMKLSSDPSDVEMNKKDNRKDIEN